MAFKRMLSVDDLPVGSAIRIDDPTGAIAVFNVSGNFYAISDKCSHGQWSLADGFLDGEIVECSLHMGKFCVRNGKAVQLPAARAVKIYPLRVVDGEIEINVEAAGYAD